MKNSRRGLAHLGRCAVAVSRVGEKVSGDRPGRHGCSRENLIPEVSWELLFQEKGDVLVNKYILCRWMERQVTDRYLLYT